MIIVNVTGGLGNQMFQYSAGCALARRRQQPLFLDISSFESYTLHQGYELERLFGDIAPTAEEDQLRNVLGWQSSATVRRILSRPSMRVLRKKGLVIEPHFEYWRDIDQVPQSCYLSGYWQSEKYFADATATIRQAFRFQAGLSAANTQTAQRIDQSNAISIHVRRGDYVSNQKVAATHGVCDLAYYRAAIAYIAERIKEPTFFVFSDDSAWVKSNLSIKHPHHFIDNNAGQESYNDMRLMSLCRHHVIANSSFSWWGAWLNASPDKIVIAPKTWFVSNALKAVDLIPAGWVRL